jgi:hypothetical protein
LEIEIIEPLSHSIKEKESNVNVKIKGHKEYLLFSLIDKNYKILKEFLLRFDTQTGILKSCSSPPWSVSDMGFVKDWIWFEKENEQIKLARISASTKKISPNTLHND